MLFDEDLDCDSDILRLLRQEAGGRLGPSDQSVTMRSLTPTSKTIYEQTNMRY